MQVMYPASSLEYCSCAMMKSAPCLPIKITTFVAIDTAGFWHRRSDRYSSALVHLHEIFYPFNPKFCTYFITVALNGLNTSFLLNNLQAIRAILLASATAVLYVPIRANKPNIQLSKFDKFTG